MPSSELGRIDLGDVTPHNIKLLRKVNQVVFPVSYHDKFYKVSVPQSVQASPHQQKKQTNFLAGCVRRRRIGKASFL